MFADRTTKESRDRSRMNSGERPVEPAMFIKELWRYPVKSMAGERVTQIQVGELGFADDRKVLARAGNGHVLTSRTHHQLLGPKGTLVAAGQPQASPPVTVSPHALA